MTNLASLTMTRLTQMNTLIILAYLRKMKRYAAKGDRTGFLVAQEQYRRTAYLAQGGRQ